MEKRKNIVKYTVVGILIFSMVFIAINGLVSSYLVASGNVYISGAITIQFGLE